eukprot:Polyplicarium_translucidae@DN284_c0_g1_i1.p1
MPDMNFECCSHARAGNAEEVPIVCPSVFSHDDGAEALVSFTLPNLRDLAISAGFPEMKVNALFRSARPMSDSPDHVRMVLHDCLKINTMVDLRERHLADNEIASRIIVENLYSRQEASRKRSSALRAHRGSPRRAESRAVVSESTAGGAGPPCPRKLYVCDILDSDVAKAKAKALLKEAGYLPRFAFYKGVDKLTGSKYTNYYFCKYIIQGGGLAASYIDMLEHCGGCVELALRVIAKSAIPVLIHCSIGKDRTGIIAMLILHCLGASEAAIARDYSRTEETGLAFRAHVKEFVGRSGLEGDFCGAEASTIVRCMEILKEKYGSIDGYLDSIGFHHQWRQHLRQKFLVSQEAADSP